MRISILNLLLLLLSRSASASEDSILDGIVTPVFCWTFSDHCEEVFPLLPIGTCESGYEATLFGFCEEEE